MAEVRIGDIVELLGASYEGDREKLIRGVRPISEAGPDELTFLSNPKYAGELETSNAAAVLVDTKLPGTSDRWIRVPDPYYALALVLQRWFAGIPRPSGISANSFIAASARVGEDVRIGDRVTVGENVVIGNGVTIFDGTFVGAGTTIGEGTLIHPNVTIYHRTRIGRRCVIQGGAVIGSDGFGFATAEGRHHKIPQIGIVRIEDDVEIGANTTIDRAALGETVIGEGTKIDNLVQIAHNVKIGRHCFIVSQVGIAGSTEIGDYSVFAGQSGAAGHLEIGSRVQVAAQAAVMKGFDGPLTIAGSPARPLREHLRSEALIRRLPEIRRRLERIEKRLGITRADEDGEER
ncbi:MAG: UDP-3-O-(3-hydroxymyristoyl)glucosamine N-acyltransferase [Thermoanaerobaculia bacterium]